MTATVLFWLLVAVNAGLLLTMRSWTIRAIGEAGTAFDLRRRGYTPEEARTFLAALSPGVRDLYLGPQRLLDGALILAYVPLLLILLHRVWDAPSGMVLSLAPIATGLADATENARVAAMLRAGASGVTDGQVRAASRATVAKFVLLGLSCAAILLGWVL